MSTLGTRPLLYLGLSLFESQKVYNPDSIARRVVNMDREADGTLSTIPGPGRYDPKNTTTLPNILMGLAHAETLDGANQVTVVRSGTALYRHQGWTRTWSTLLSNLTYDPNQPFPDVCLPVAGRIVWSNGIDRPQVVDCAREYGRLVTPLGFAYSPSAPTVLSPSVGSYEMANAGSGSSYGVGSGTAASNMAGYSVPGDIGTVSQFNGEDGALLSSAHLYCLQWEDIHGNLSPLSPPSNLATIQAQSAGYLTPQIATYVRKNRLDMLRRGFCVRGMDIGETHVMAMRLYRTTDLNHTDGKYHLLTRIRGRQAFAYPDAKSDTTLVNGDEPVRPVEVLPFRVACEYQGRLVAANYAGNPGLVRWSQPGFLGTFLEDDYTIPDAGGAQVTAAIAYNGGVYLFTESSAFQLNIDAEGSRLRPLPIRTGCIAPSTLQVLPNGRLMFLSRLGMVSLGADDSLVDVGLDIQDSLAKLQLSRAGRSVGAIDPDTGIYLLGMPTRGPWNDTLKGFDFRVNGWRDYDSAPQVPTVLHAAAGRAGHLLFGGYDTGAGTYTLRVWKRPDVTGLSALPPLFESNELRLDPQGLKVFRCRGILVGFIESDAHASDPGCAAQVWVTSRRTGATPADSYYTTTLELVGQDFLDTWAMGELTLNTGTPDTGAYFRNPMVTWRILPVDVSMISGLRFQLSMSADRRMHLHGFAILAEEQGFEASRVAGPKRNPT